MTGGKRGRFGLAFVTVLLAGVPAWWLQHEWGLLRRMQTIVAAPPPAAAAQSCAPLLAQRPLVLLVLGQSNAGNHGAPARDGATIAVWADGQCLQSADPLPGATGRGGSIWSQLPTQLAPQHAGRPVLIAPLAVDATTIADWTRWSSPLRRRLHEVARALLAQGLPPTLVLWQQGEADARAGTPAADYAAGLERLVADLRATGIEAPILIAKSTVCRTPPDAAIGDAVTALIERRPDLRDGVDMDAEIGADLRADGCHLSAAGARRAAALWARAIERALGPRR